MRVFQSVEEAKQHIESNLRGLAKGALDRSQESRRRYETESDQRLKQVWKQESETELRIAKMINKECDELLKLLPER